MPKFEMIEGSRRNALFRELIKDKTLVRLSLPSDDYEILTLITGMSDGNSDPTFQIDPPKGLADAVARRGSDSIRFEFHSNDRVTHRFESKLRTMTRDSVTLEFPAVIRRHQKRNNFRVKTFRDSYATVCVGDSEIRLDIDNISQGGAYCLCRNIHKQFFEENLILKNMSLYLTLENERFLVPIRRFEVRRLESESKPKHFGVAFKFIKIDRDARKRLVQQIYELQRFFLQNRFKVPR